MKETQRKKTGTPEGVHLWLLLWKATKSLEVKARQSVRGTGLGLSDFGVLEALLHKGPLAVNAVREKVLINSGSMTAAVDRLEQNGLVERAATETDRRTRIVHLTNKGQGLIVKLFESHACDMEEAFSCLNKKERQMLASLLRKLKRSPEALKAPAAKQKGRS